ncbi:hypothetical protein GPECTOR_19g295 [Gonium pectorale]|uniref:Uncharacterized protein n=1 Tax=Gonium pectorale TaxID=33097 RepID=A0A150GJ99_GONPE|nr:hypothetical protein GPECTOR_19g295 [Gonium pectorale]|eukprot:KXZ49844.1 hypothetical protein GPECTOR_19g295 [Gonium pectorale]
MLYNRWVEAFIEQGRLAGALAASDTEKAMAQEPLGAREAAYAELHRRLLEGEELLAACEVEKAQLQTQVKKAEATVAGLWSGQTQLSAAAAAHKVLYSQHYQRRMEVEAEKE